MRLRLPVLLAGAVVVTAGCTGPAPVEPVLFAELGTGSAAARPSTGAVELTDSSGLDRLDLGGPGSVSGAADLPAPADDVRRFAFVLSGCAETSAELVVDDGVAEATAVGDDDVACDAPEFYLAVFDVPRSDVPDGVVLR